MKPEKLYGMAFALAMLIALGFVVKIRRATHEDISQTYVVHRLVPEDFRVADVERVRFYRGADPAAGVSMARTRDTKGEPVGWKVESRFDGPGDGKKLEDFLAELRDKEGEFRSDKAGVHADFELTDETAIHISLFKKDSQDPWVHLLLGKGEGWKGGFVRLAGQDTVFTVDANFRNTLGFFGDEKGKQPESTEWLSKIVIDLDREKIAKVELTYPDKKLVLEKKKIEKPAAEAGQPAASETKWEVAVGGALVPPDGKLAALTDHGPNTVLNALDSFKCTDVVDPAKKKDWGLESPTYRCEAVMEDGTRHVLVAGRPEPGGEAFLVVEGTDRPVFKVERYLFDNLFKHGSEIFTMKGLDLTEAEVARVRVQVAGGTLAFARPPDAAQKGWTLAEPAVTPAPAVRGDKVDSLLQRFAHWSPADYADAATPTGLDQPAAVFEVTTKQGKTWSLALGAHSMTLQGRYAKLTEPDVPAGNFSPVVVSAGDAALVEAPLGSYLDLKVIDAEPGQMAKISVSRAEKGFVLARKTAEGKATGPWTAQTPEGEKETDSVRVDALLSVLAALSGSDVRFGADAATPPTLPSVAFTLRVEAADGRSWELAFGPEQEGRVCAQPTGNPYLLVFPAGTAGDVAPDPATLLKQEPAKKEEGKSEEKKAEAGKAEEPKKEESQPDDAKK